MEAFLPASHMISATRPGAFASPGHPIRAANAAIQLASDSRDPAMVRDAAVVRQRLEELDESSQIDHGLR